MDLATFSRIFSHLTLLILLTGTIIGFISYKKLSKSYKSITAYLFLMLLIDITAKIVGIYGSNFILLPIYTIIELCFFVYFYKTFLLRRYNKIFICLGILGSIFIVSETVTYFVLDDIDTKQFQPYAKVVDNFIIILMALAFYLEKISQFKESGWKYFRLNTVILAFFTITILVFLPFNFMINESTGLKHYFWIVNTIAVLLFYVYLVFIIWQNARQDQLNSRQS